MNVLIIGGGVAGPVTAMALQKSGIDATIVEAHKPGPVEVGSYFTIAPNGLDALRAVGALDLAKQIGFPHRRNVLLDAKGGLLGSVGLGRPLEDGTPALTMRRATLSGALLEEAAGRGIQVEA